VHGCLTFQDYHIFTVHRIELREFISAKFFCLFLMVSEIEAFKLFYF
jgi:hypothetical protein